MKINMTGIKNTNYSLPGISGNINDVQKNIKAVTYSLDSRVMNSYEIGRSLAEVNNRLIKCVESLNEIYNFIDCSMQEYSCMENKINNDANELR